jgi:hypothetical protein
MRRSTGSTCINIYKKVRKNNHILNDEYFGKKNEKKIQAYSFNDFIKKFFYLKPDIIKIDVEGYELDIINSIIKKYDPFLIEVEREHIPFFDETHHKDFSIQLASNTMPRGGKKSKTRKKKRIASNYARKKKIKHVQNTKKRKKHLKQNKYKE